MSQKLPIVKVLNVQRMSSLEIITDRLSDDRRSLGSVLNEMGNHLVPITSFKQNLNTKLTAKTKASFKTDMRGLQKHIILQVNLFATMG